MDAERRVSTKPAAIRLTRIGARSSATLAMSVANATVTFEAIPRPAHVRRAPVPPMNTRDPGGLTLSAASRAIPSASNRCSVRPRRASSGDTSRGGP